jgi:hypothetical protein
VSAVTRRIMINVSRDEVSPMDELRNILTEMADAARVYRGQGTFDAEATEEIRARMYDLARLDDAELARPGRQSSAPPPAGQEPQLPAT